MKRVMYSMIAVALFSNTSYGQGKTTAPATAPGSALPQTSGPKPGVPQTAAPTPGLPQTAGPKPGIPLTGAGLNLPQLPNSQIQLNPQGMFSPFTTPSQGTAFQSMTNFQNSFLTGGFFGTQTANRNIVVNPQTNLATGTSAPGTATGTTATPINNGGTVGTNSGQSAFPASASALTSPTGALTTTVPQQSTTAPWFFDARVAGPFNFSTTQTATLSKAYNDSLTAYNMGLAQINGNLTGAQQQQARANLQNAYYQSLTNAVNQANLTPQQQVQYNQLYFQRQGYTAFADPSLQQRLMLTNSQTQALTQQGQALQQQLSALQAAYNTDPVGTTQLYNALVKQTQQQFSQLLTPQQLQDWQQLTGPSFVFPALPTFQQVGG
jgi:hypothetical protein